MSRSSCLRRGRKRRCASRVAGSKHHLRELIAACRLPLSSPRYRAPTERARVNKTPARGAHPGARACIRLHTRHWPDGKAFFPRASAHGRGSGGPCTSSDALSAWGHAPRSGAVPGWDKPSEDLRDYPVTCVFFSSVDTCEQREAVPRESYPRTQAGGRELCVLFVAFSGCCRPLPVEVPWWRPARSLPVCAWGKPVVGGDVTLMMGIVASKASVGR